MHVVITFTGRDRPGVVHRISSIVRAHGGNWEESRMAHLVGRFAGVVSATLPGENVAALTSDLADLAGDGLRILVDTGDAVVEASRAGWERIRIDCTGTDRVGIVEELTGILEQRGVNILEMTTSATEAPMTGGFLFHAFASVELPPGLSLGTLEDALHALGDSQLIELHTDG